MTTFFALCFFVSTSIFAIAQTSPQTPQSPLAQILIAKSQAVMQSLNSKDLTTLRSLLDDNFRTVASDGSVYGKGELLGAAQEGDLKAFTIYDPQVFPIDDDTAIVTYNTILTIPEGDDGFAPRYQKIADLWVKQGDDWKLKFEQSTPLRHID